METCGNTTRVRQILQSVNVDHVSCSMEQPHVTFHKIHTREHVYTVIMHGGYCYFMCVYPVLIAQRICCISIDFYEVLAVVSHIKTSILTIM